jgi:hypothetical protein
MLIFDFFAGTGSATQAFEDAGHTVIKVEMQEKFAAHERDILELSADYLIQKYGQPDFIWASPPCTTFSIASVYVYWNKDGTVKDDRVYHGIALVKKAKELIADLKPTHGFVMENPRGMLRKQEFMQDMKRHTITYCQYGDFRMKPTDVWTDLEKWTPRKQCSPGADCHEGAPRGSATGSTRLSREKRSMIPYQLGEEILQTLTMEATNGTTKD